MRALRRFRDLPPGRRRALASALPVVVAVRIAYFALPFSHLRAALRRLGRSRLPARHDRSVDELAWAVGAAGRRIPGANCMVQALALELLLARRGRPGEVRVGVAKDGGALRAHAWVESEGRIVLGQEESRRFELLTGG